MAKKRSDKYKQITFWVPVEQVARLDAHLERGEANLLGARLTRASWLAALVDREMASDQPAGAR